MLRASRVHAGPGKQIKVFGMKEPVGLARNFVYGVPHPGTRPANPPQIVFFCDARGAYPNVWSQQWRFDIQRMNPGSRKGYLTMETGQHKMACFKKTLEKNVTGCEIVTDEFLWGIFGGVFASWVLAYGFGYILGGGQARPQFKGSSYGKSIHDPNWARSSEDIDAWRKRHYASRWYAQGFRAGGGPPLFNGWIFGY